MSVTNAINPEKAQELLRRFCQLYGEGGVRVLRAPARINVLGEHVDYVSYLPTSSLPFGSREHAMLMLYRPTNDGAVRGASTSARFPAFSFALSETHTPDHREPSWEELVFNRPLPVSHWGNYVKGAVSFAQWKHGTQITRGVEFLVDSTIPANSGASSSSALVVLAGAAIRHANQIEFSLNELAQDSSQAEWFLGTRGGALDHTAICRAEPAHAVHVRFAENRAELVPLPDEPFRWLTFFTHAADKGREVMLEYNERAAVSRLLIPAVIQSWRQHRLGEFSHWLDGLAGWQAGDSQSLASLQAILENLPATIRLKEVAEVYPQAFADCQRAFPTLVQDRLEKPLKLRDRALHHAGEVRRVALAVNALREMDDRRLRVHDGMRQLGELITESHDSLRDLYEVSTPEVERIIELVRADEQVYGARLMGGGFGGNVLVLTTARNVSSLVGRVHAGYYRPQGRDGVREGSVMISTPGDGLSEIAL